MRNLLSEPRIIIGIVLMCVATALGGVTLQRATQRTPVWSLEHAVTSGTVLTASDVHVAEVAMPEVALYANAGQRVVGRTLVRDLAAGELLPLASLGDADAPDAVALQSEHLHVSRDVGPGSRVDVWWTLGDAQRAPLQTTRVLARVPVLSATATDLGGREIVLGVPHDRVQSLVLAMRSGAIDVVGVR